MCTQRFWESFGNAVHSGKTELTNAILLFLNLITITTKFLYKKQNTYFFLLAFKHATHKILKNSVRKEIYSQKKRRDPFNVKTCFHQDRINIRCVQNNPVLQINYLKNMKQHLLWVEFASDVIWTQDPKVCQTVELSMNILQMFAQMKLWKNNMNSFSSYRTPCEHFVDHWFYDLFVKTFENRGLNHHERLYPADAVQVEHPATVYDHFE